MINTITEKGLNMKIGQFDSEDLFEAYGPYARKNPADIERIKKALEREKKHTGTHKKETPTGQPS